MITGKEMRHIRTSRNIRSFRSCKHSVGIGHRHLEDARLDREKERLKDRQQHHEWLLDQWEKHFDRAGR